MIKDAVCSFCGCLCDDINVEVEDGKIQRVRHACRLGSSKIMGHGRIAKPHDSKRRRAGGGKLPGSIRLAAEILLAAAKPLMYGWASTSCEAAKKGILLAEEVGSSSRLHSHGLPRAVRHRHRGEGAARSNLGPGKEPGRHNRLLGLQSCGSSPQTFSALLLQFLR